ncbi:oxygen-regulated protein 1-like isoform X3 [Stegostoma tigrinum]|uniref:oxygen-regulated protein 1-like isoform X3 n=1 Tax=Stegostoma tigrinum TaxID=3053191 RepID=UPI00287077DB|nr:oxygen-regulated protein 1-like isoform X3 [Stegostoma tigrinum]
MDEQQSSYDSLELAQIAKRVPKKLVIFRNGDPTFKRNLILNRNQIQNFDVLLNHVSELMNFPVLKLYSIDGKRTLKNRLPGSTRIDAQKKRLNKETQQTIRQTIVPLLIKRTQTNTFNKEESNVLKNIKKTKSIIIVPADKDRMTVVINEMDYTQKAEELFADT